MIEYWVSSSSSGRAMLDKMLKKHGILNYSIETTKQGKPFIAGNPIYFNISHSGDLTAVCVSDAEVGIDIQIIKPINPRIAERFFTQNEYEYFCKAGLDGFFKIWTRKESLLKYLGLTLAGGISKFDVFSEDVYFFEKQIKNYRMCICCAKKTDIVDISDDI